MSLDTRNDNVDAPMQQPEPPARDAFADVRFSKLDEVDRERPSQSNEPQYISKAMPPKADTQLAFLDVTPIFNDGLPGQAPATDGKPKRNADGSITYKREDGTSLKEKPDGSKLEINAQNQVTTLTYADGTSRQFTWEGKELVATTARDGKVWERVKRGGQYVDEWTQKGVAAQPWKGALSIDTNGDYTYKSTNAADKGTTVVSKTDETKRTLRPDGTVSLVNEKENFKADYDRNGNASQITYPDGKVRTFTYRGGQIQTVEIKEPGVNGAVTRWDKIGEGKFRSNTGIDWNVKFDVKGDKYTVTELDADNKTTTRMPDGRMVEEFPKEKRKLETLKGQVTSITVDGKEVSFDRDKSGSVTQITNKPSREVLKKNEDGTWTAFDRNNKKIDDGLQRTGDPVINDKGVVTFLSADGGLIKQAPGKAPEKIKNDLPIEKEIIDNKNLNDEAKVRFLENLNVIQNSSTISAAEKEAFFKQTSRLLEEKADAPFSAKERAAMAEQLAWHVANPTLDSQGPHPTCNVTDIRLCLTREQPSEFARMIADIGNTGKFVTQDGTTIEPRKDSLQAGKEESTFPPAPGTRTWLGKISDVTMANIHWQRRTTDVYGYAVAKGSMKYDEVKPTDRDDSGSRVHKYELRQDVLWRTEQAKSPTLRANQIMDIYKQITGKEEEGRFIINADHNQTGQGLAVVGSKEDLHNALLKGPWPKIIEVQNNILQGKQPDGKDHEHVVIATGYDPKTGKVMIDNSHNPSQDMLEQDKQVSIDTLYQATKLRQSVQVVYQHQQQQYYHQGYQHGYYQNYGYRNGGYRYR